MAPGSGHNAQEPALYALQEDGAGLTPPIPTSLAATGLTSGYVGDLLLKVLHVRGESTGAQLSEIVRLPFIILEDVLLELVQRHWIEVRGGGTMSRANQIFELTSAGEQRALMELATCRYVGPAPITLEHYSSLVARQSVHEVHLSQQRIRDGFSELVLSSAFLDRIGPAVNSARSLFLYGAAGNGKTLIAETIAALLGEPIYVPYAVLVEGQIMIIYDPASHVTSSEEEVDGTASAIWRSAAAHDGRCVKVRRPAVSTGGELTLDQLEMNFDASSGIYQAPVQVKANGGVLILDDFGRQRVPSRVLLNRWMVPLEQRRDLLALNTGTRFPVPFDCLLIFATNLEPSALVEEAFLRRIRYKILVDGPSREQYEEIFRRACARSNLPFDAEAVKYIYARFYEQLGIEVRACHPRDIVDHVTDVARYLGRAPELTPELIDRACESYFLSSTEATVDPGTI
jgi:hypothetical protein